jgi:hypothetical protein
MANHARGSHEVYLRIRTLGEEEPSEEASSFKVSSDFRTLRVCDKRVFGFDGIAEVRVVT